MSVIGKQDKIQVQIKDGKISKSFTIYGMSIDKAYNTSTDLFETIANMEDGDEVKIKYRK